MKPSCLANLITVPSVELSDTEKFEKSASKKYRLFSVDEFLLMPPRLIKTIQMNEAMVKTIGVKIHATRPPFPMLGVK